MIRAELFATSNCRLPEVGWTWISKTPSLEADSNQGEWARAATREESNTNRGDPWLR